jgi:hypothetical protein
MLRNGKSFLTSWGHIFLDALGKDGVTSKVKLPIEEQHPIVQWHTFVAISQQSSKVNSQGLYEMKSGAVNAWFRLAYDLYLIEHNSELQKRLIKAPRYFKRVMV